MNKKKVLLIRLDKIGDLICTLPVDQIFYENQFDITWVVQKGLGQILDLGEKKRSYIEIDKNTPDSAQKIFQIFLEQNHFEYAISFQCPWWINWLLFKNKIPHRIGVLSQWHSFLFLNKGLRQKRSKALQHEFEYNLDLTEKITGPVLDKKNKAQSTELMFKFKKPKSTATLEKFHLHVNYAIVHPGMMGSALNISQDKYIQWINLLVDHHIQVVITGTKSDLPYLNIIQKYAHENLHWQNKVVWLVEKLSFKELIEVLNYSQYVIAPSTGVAHMAAALDKKVITVFSPVQVHHPLRWSPRGQQVEVLLPNVQCPAQFTCLKEKCRYFNCMETLQLSENLNHQI